MSPRVGMTGCQMRQYEADQNDEVVAGTLQCSLFLGTQGCD